MILIGISLTVAAGFLVAFLWSVRSGQYSDTYTPSVRMLFDESSSSSDNSNNKNNSENKSKSH